MTENKHLMKYEQPKAFIGLHYHFGNLVKVYKVNESETIKPVCI